VVISIGHPLALAFRRSVRFVRMFCVLSLAIASIVHVFGDFRANGADIDAGQAAVSSASNDLESEGGQAAEVCHSCSVSPYFTAASVLFFADTSSEVPEGRLIEVAVASSRLAGPPPKT